MQKPQIEIFNTKNELAIFFGNILAKETAKKESVSIALSGGSTPRAIFDVLVSHFKEKIEWSKLRVFWGDERCVPPNHEDSNYGMTKEFLLNKVPINPNNVFRVLGETEPKNAAEKYEESIIQNTKSINNLPAFDIMVLGMGDDGHTASIFPHEIDLWQSDKICEVATHPQSGQKRVTITGNTINNSEKIIFLVTGSNKAIKADEIINQNGDFSNYPASLVSKDKSVWLMDVDAAKDLE